MTYYYHRECFVLSCLGGPLDGTTVEVASLPEVGVGTMDFSCNIVNENTVHRYRCLPHPHRPGILAYVYEGIAD